MISSGSLGLNLKLETQGSGMCVVKWPQSGEKLFKVFLNIGSQCMVISECVGEVLTGLGLA
jgi:hypothetical protein